MNKFKKITLGLLGIALLTTGLYSCSNDNEETDKQQTENKTANAREDKIQTFYGKIPLKGVNDESTIPNIEVTVDVETEEVIGYKIDPIVSEYYKIEPSELNTLFKIEMGSLINTLNGEPDRGEKFTDHAGCIEACKDKYTNPDGTKKPGRGGCKASCWVDTAVKVIEAIANGMSRS